MTDITRKLFHSEKVEVKPTSRVASPQTLNGKCSMPTSTLTDLGSKGRAFVDFLSCLLLSQQRAKPCLLGGPSNTLPQFLLSRHALRIGKYLPCARKFCKVLYINNQIWWQSLPHSKWEGLFVLRIIRTKCFIRTDRRSFCFSGVTAVSSMIFHSWMLQCTVAAPLY